MAAVALRTKRSCWAAYAASSTPGALLAGDFGGAVVNVGGRVKPRSASRNATGLEVIDDRMVCTITIAGVEELESRELL